MENEILLQILSELKELKQGQGNLETRMASLETRMASLEAGQASLVSDVQEIKERLILIENDHGKRLRALEDGYVLLYDISKEIREDVRRLYAYQDKQDTRIMLLDLESEKRKAGGTS